MNKPYLVAALGALCLVAADEVPQWIEYSPPNRNYKVLLLGQPEENKVRRPEGEAHVVKAARPNGALILMVVVQEAAEGLRSREEAKAFVEGLEEGFVQAAKAKVVSSTDIELGELPGKETLADGFLGKWVRCRGYAVGKRSYQVMAVSEERDALYSDEATKFFASFEILELPTPVFEHETKIRELARKAGEGAAILVVVLLVVGFFVRGQRKQAKPNEP
jgi:hypothetical protein